MFRAGLHRAADTDDARASVVDDEGRSQKLLMAWERCVANDVGMWGLWFGLPHMPVALPPPPQRRMAPTSVPAPSPRPGTERSASDHSAAEEGASRGRQRLWGSDTHARPPVACQRLQDLHRSDRDARADAAQLWRSAGLRGRHGLAGRAPGRPGGRARAAAASLRFRGAAEHGGASAARRRPPAANSCWRSCDRQTAATPDCSAGQRASQHVGAASGVWHLWGEAAVLRPLHVIPNARKRSAFSCLHRQAALMLVPHSGKCPLCIPRFLLLLTHLTPQVPTNSNFDIRVTDPVRQGEGVAVSCAPWARLDATAHCQLQGAALWSCRCVSLRVNGCFHSYSRCFIVACACAAHACPATCHRTAAPHPPSCPPPPGTLPRHM